MDDGTGGVGPMSWTSRMARGIARAGYTRAGQQAGAQAMGAARTLGGNNLAAARAGAMGASRATAQMAGAGAQNDAQMMLQQQQAEQQRQLMERERADRFLGAGLSAAGGGLSMLLQGMPTPGAGGAGTTSGLPGATMVGSQTAGPNALAQIMARNPPQQPGAPVPIPIWPSQQADMAAFDPVAQMDPQAPTMGAVDQALGITGPAATPQPQVAQPAAPAAPAQPIPIAVAPGTAMERRNGTDLGAMMQSGGSALGSLFPGYGSLIGFGLGGLGSLLRR